LDLATIELPPTTVAEPVMLVELPSGRGTADFQLDKLQWNPGRISRSDIQNDPKPVSTPSGTAYDWRGIKLYVDASLPAAPPQVGLYEANPDHHATLDSARALAEQFGMNGQIYESPPELGGSEQIDFLIVDGNQHLRVRSNLYFSYYPDYPRWNNNVTGQPIDQVTAENLIKNFLPSHGFDFPFVVEKSELYNGFYALPLTPEGLPIHHNHFSAGGFLFRFDQDELLAVEASLVTYSLVDNFEVISAEDALQKSLSPNNIGGILEGSHSVNEPIETWHRPRPDNQTITVWGWISSVKSAEGGPPLVMFDGYQAAGNLAGLAESTPNTFAEVTGQFQSIDGNKVFNIESWQIFDGFEDGHTGTIHRDGAQVVLDTLDGLRLTLPDIPTDFPLPMENAFVLGITQGNVFEWKSIDNRSLIGGGGGGGGGSGFYKPNLTGTPVPFPIAQLETGTGTGEYIVQEGDTLSGIAETYESTVDELMQANGLNEATIFIGQTLLVPGLQEETSPVGQTFDGQRGMLLVTITNKLDGSQSVDFKLQIGERENQFQLMKLEGNGLGDLQNHNNLPIDIWGTVKRLDTDHGMSIPVINVERFEIPYPDLTYQIFKGTQSIATEQGETVMLFTTQDGQTYAQTNAYGGLVGNEGDQLLMEALVLPDEIIAGYPVLQAVSISMAINPKSGEPVEMEATANQPYVINEADNPGLVEPSEPMATIESVGLVYFTIDQRYALQDATGGPVYLQPAWRFQGHYWDGSEFEILVQALKDEFLLPEIDGVEPPG
jgi:LysM repeat protein